MALKKSDLYSSLWASCDELRGGMDASQYKDYVLVLLFMKYVSDKAASQKGYLLDVPKGGSFADMVALKGDKEIGDKINKIIGNLNIILSQQYLHQNVQEICLLVQVDSSIIAIDDGEALYSYIFVGLKNIPPSQWNHSDAISMYTSMQEEFRSRERIQTIVADKEIPNGSTIS